MQTGWKKVRQQVGGQAPFCGTDRLRGHASITTSLLDGSVRTRQKLAVHFNRSKLGLVIPQRCRGGPRLERKPSAHGY